MNTIEGVLLTGGQSRRMRADKSALEIGGQALGERIAAELALVTSRVTILGRTRIAGYEFLPDKDQFGGPRRTLASYNPSSDLVFVCSCDIPLFRAEVVSVFRTLIGKKEGVVPILAGRHQPLCALYTAEAIRRTSERLDENARVMAWIERLELLTLDEEALVTLGIDPKWLTGCNTPEEFRALIGG